MLFHCSNRVFTEGTCKLLNLVISDLVDEDYVLHSRKQVVSALMFGTTALVSKPGQTLAPLIGIWLLSVQTGKSAREYLSYLMKLLLYIYLNFIIFLLCSMAMMLGVQKNKQIFFKQNKNIYLPLSFLCFF